MPKYRYTAVDSHRKPVSGELEAASVEAARQGLAAGGLDPQSISLSEIRRPARREGWLSTEEVVELARGLAELSKAGLPLAGGLRALARELPGGRLPGVLREAVMELCGEMDIECLDDRPLTVHEMLAAEEMFVTGSCTGVRPVVRVERRAVGDEKPGPLARRIMQAYQQMLDRECPPGPAETRKG